MTWLIPLFATIGFWIMYFIYRTSDDDMPGDYGYIGSALGNAFKAGVALIASLTAWLIWALTT